MLVTPTDVAENLGTWFDIYTSLTTYINKTCKAAFYFFKIIQGALGNISLENLQKYWFMHQ